jgi:hypothetical protein
MFFLNKIFGSCYAFVDICRPVNSNCRFNAFKSCLKKSSLNPYALQYLYVEVKLYWLKLVLNSTIFRHKKLKISTYLRIICVYTEVCNVK